ncbi:MAG: hypothetical protein WAM27_09585 [Nitrososphaeraceae archaeon]
MSFPYNSDKRFLIYQLKWMSVYIAMGAAIALVLPFPVSLFVALGAFVLLNFIRTRRMLKRAGVDMKGLFRSFSSASMNGGQYTPIKYYCMSCGKEHREIACPNCGSKMKRIG